MHRRKFLELWWTVPVTITFGIMGVLGYRAKKITFDKEIPGEPKFISKTAKRITKVDYFRNDYEIVDFIYEGIPSFIICLPERTKTSIKIGQKYYTAYSRVCTHHGCLVELIKDPEVIAFAYNYRNDRPMICCPCHYSVFDPVKDGRVALGQAIYPLPRIKIEVIGKFIYSSGIEKAPKLFAT
jgi:Rieske Fe-S protein